MILRTELEARKRDLRVLHRRLELVTQGVLDPAIVVGDVEPFPKKKRASRDPGKGTMFSKPGAAGPSSGVQHELVLS